MADDTFLFFKIGMVGINTDSEGVVTGYTPGKIANNATAPSGTRAVLRNFCRGLYIVTNARA